jgi:Fur family ferric uptake transcriptional regulator
MTVKTNLNEALEDLRRRGYRLTPQREAILRVFQTVPSGTHLSAEDLHQHVADSGISLATTYRTLKLLASMGLLRELDLAEGHKHYEPNTPQSAPHHHLVCVSCSQAIEFEKTELYDLGLQVANAHGYRMLDVQYKVYGVCAACDARETRK